MGNFQFSIFKHVDEAQAGFSCRAISKSEAIKPCILKPMAANQDLSLID